MHETLDLLLNDNKPGLYNVNFPQLPNGIEWTRQSVRQYDGYVIPGKRSYGKKYILDISKTTGAGRRRNRQVGSRK